MNSPNTIIFPSSLFWFWKKRERIWDSKHPHTVRRLGMKWLQVLHVWLTQQLLKCFSDTLTLITLCWTAVTEYHKLEIYFSQFWSLGSRRSRHQQIHCLGRAHFLVHRQPFSHCVLALWKHLFYKSTNPIQEGFDLITSSKSYLLIPSLWGLEFQHIFFFFFFFLRWEGT